MRRATPPLVVTAALGPGWKALPGRTPVIAGTDLIAVLARVQIVVMTQGLGSVRKYSRGNRAKSRHTDIRR